MTEMVAGGQLERNGKKVWFGAGPTHIYARIENAPGSMVLMTVKQASAEGLTALRLAEQLADGGPLK